MKKWLRRIRAAVKMGLTWAAAWFGAGMVLLVAGFEADVPFPLFFGFLGFFAGVIFSGILGIMENRRKFADLSLARFAGWGAAGGFLLSSTFVAIVTLGGDKTSWGDLLGLGGIFALAGAASAAGSLLLARKAERRELRSSGADADAMGLTEAEMQELLGGGE